MADDLLPPRAAATTHPAFPPHDDAEALEVARRRSIFACVRENPAAHLRDLARRSGMPLGTALYHLDRLERSGLVVSRRDGRYRRYFEEHAFGPADKQMLCALRLGVPFRIAIALLQTGSASQRELALRLGISLSTASTCMKELAIRGLVEREPVRPEGRYHLVDATRAGQLVQRYAASLAGRAPALAASDLAPPLEILAPTVALAGGA